MSTSDTKTTFHTSFRYFLISVFCLLFGIIYEHFSHEVYSGYMMYAFAIPLLGGGLVFALLGLIKPIPLPSRFSMDLYHCGIATLTIGSIIQGVLDIYGTTNALINLYWVAGALLVFAGIMKYIIDRYRKCNRE